MLLLRSSPPATFVLGHIFERPNLPEKFQIYKNSELSSGISDPRRVNK